MLTDTELDIVLPIIREHRDGVINGEFYYGDAQSNLEYVQAYAMAITELTAGLPLDEFTANLVIDLVKEHKRDIQSGAISCGTALDRREMAQILTNTICALRKTGVPA